jgi:hypothetical protein
VNRPRWLAVARISTGSFAAIRSDIWPVRVPRMRCTKNNTLTQERESQYYVFQVEGKVLLHIVRRPREMELGRCCMKVRFDIDAGFDFAALHCTGFSASRKGRCDNFILPGRCLHFQFCTQK